VFVNNQQIIDIFTARATDQWIMNIDDWGWNNGVLLYCMSRVYEKTGEEILYGYIKRWIDAHKANRRFETVNSVVAAHGCLTLTDGRDEYREIADEYADWCKYGAVFTCDGGISHTCGFYGPPENISELWLDTLYMGCPFMVRYGLMFGDEEIIDKALAQIDIHTNGAYDEATGLYFHAYDSASKKQLGARWGRGNGWVAAALAHIIVMLDGKRDMSKYKALAVRMVETAYSMRRAEDGLLRTVLNNPDSYTEYTATMLFAIAAFDLRRAGLLKEEIHVWARRLAQTAPAMIGENGPIAKCSVGTDPGPEENYLARPYNETFYAYGLFMLLLSNGETAGV
jgi:unsaturated rhamnogalacturonyl hydrolase